MPGDDAGGRPSQHAEGSAEVFQAGRDQYFFGTPGERPAPPWTVPRDAGPLIGRDAEIERLTAGDGLHLIAGMPGVGKTALAVHVAHLLRPRYPDGGFLVDLKAHAPGMRAVTPEDALYQLLIADGLSPGQIATGAEARALQWRNRLAARRCVVVLDNALDRPQVAPLLPAGGDSVVLVTSRRRLTGLMAQHAADALELPTLTDAAAAALFARRSGREHRGSESAAVAEIVRDCGTLPLAICLLAAQLQGHPQQTAAELLRELRRAVHRTSRMRAEDLAVGPAFDLSFRRLPKPLRRFLLRLGTYPGADLDVSATAALTGVGAEEARRGLDALVQEHLVIARGAGRYQLHDLICDYTRMRNAELPNGEAERVGALARLAEDYVRRVHAADAALAVPYPPVLARVEQRTVALAWLQQQRVNLLACARELARTGEHELMARLTGGLAAFLREYGPWEQAVTLYRIAAACAARNGAHTARAVALRELAGVLYLRSEYPAAIAECERALATLRAHPGGDRAEAEEAATLLTLVAARRQAGTRTALAADLERALDLYRRSGDRAGEGEALAELGTLHLASGAYDAAVETLREATAVLLGDHASARTCAAVLNKLGAALQNRGENREATEIHEHAFRVSDILGDRRGMAVSLNYLGHLHCQAGDHERAAAVLEKARVLHERMGSRSGGAHCLLYLARAYLGLARYEHAGEAARQALSIFREMPHRTGYASALNLLGTLHRLAGDPAAAEAAHQEALDVFVEEQSLLGQAEVRNAQGDLDRLTKRVTRALDRHRCALDLATRAGGDAERARAYRGIGHCLTALGEDEAGRDAHRAARDILERLGAHDPAKALP
ncbi:ATP-binding protein [Catenuloplanes atrovinosus]|uniref:Tetratricopeptide (TPR) repeat protein n=1 Tax=Catenuloplanes atrovinosus TaxID=137266 RepID=A0AAE3YP10_9ACTN|nr:tetratricopeptide repeat protein [Catenuloplanes atrovinosus]MDR7275256.1 tetratricopeptide (TPR) repeat protein [Catenuloplanes atrovinosus]